MVVTAGQFELKLIELQNFHKNTKYQTPSHASPQRIYLIHTDTQAL
jgi:hypothetical protein